MSLHDGREAALRQMSTQQATDTLGGSLIGVINHLQDVFSQVEDLVPPLPPHSHLTLCCEPVPSVWHAHVVYPPRSAVSAFATPSGALEPDGPGCGLDLRTPCG